MGTAFDYFLLAAAVAFGWNLGKTAESTLSFWVNEGVNRFRIWRWAKKNPELAKRAEAFKKAQQEAMLSMPMGGPLAGDAGGDHGQYA